LTEQNVVLFSKTSLSIAGGFDIEKLQHAWADVCRTEYAYHFPVEAKNLEDDLPGWVRRLTALAQ